MNIVKQETFHEAWDCNSCGTEGLSAFDCKQCPTCGAPFDKETVYQTDNPIENYKFKGHDIVCANCQTRNEKRFSCRNCGASLDDGDDKMVAGFTYLQNKAQPKASRHEASASFGAIPITTNPSWFTNETARQQSESMSIGQSESETNWFKYLLIIGGVLLIVLLVWLVRQFQAVIPTTLDIERVHWSYKIPLEDYQPRRDSLVTEVGRSALPSGAYDIIGTKVHVRDEPIYETKKFKKTCTKTESHSNGDGSWTRTTSEYDCSYSERVQVDTKKIWGTKFDFKIDSWQSIDPIVRDGFGHQTNFPTFTTKAECLSAKPPHGCIRALSPIAIYTVYFSYHEAENRKEISKSLPRQDWEMFTPGTKSEAILNGFGQIRSIKGVDADYEEMLQN